MSVESIVISSHFVYNNNTNAGDDDDDDDVIKMIRFIDCHMQSSL